MGKEKKITVKPIANTALNYAIDKERNCKVYPLYFQVTYDRKTTKFPSIPECWVDVETLIDKDDIVGDLVYEVGEIAKFERKRRTDFTVRGLGEIYKIYKSSLRLSVEFYLGFALDDKVQEILSAKEYKRRAQNGEIGGVPINIEASLKVIGDELDEELERLLTTYKDVCNTSQDWSIAEWLLFKGREVDAYELVSSKVDVQEYMHRINETIYKMIDSRVFTVFL